LATLDSFASKPPVLHPGRVTPMLLKKMESACQNYFAAKDIAPTRMVASVLGSFQDEHITNWVSPNDERARVLALDFPAFMEEVRTILLDSDWQLQTRAQLIGLRMADKDSFDKFHTSFIALSSLLVNTSHALDTSLIRHQLESAMCLDLAFIYGRDEAVRTMSTTNAPELAAWIKAVARIDDKRRHDATTALRRWTEMDKENSKRKAKEDGERDGSFKRQAKSAPASSGASSSKPTPSTNAGSP
ncbi:hypothetical protein B0H15DRAFT_741049, partial [Mycena belliarum]